MTTTILDIFPRPRFLDLKIKNEKEQKQSFLTFYKTKQKLGVTRLMSQIAVTKRHNVTKGRCFWNNIKKLAYTLNTLREQQMLWPLLGAR